MNWPDLPAATTLYAHMPRTPLTGDYKSDHFFLPLDQSLQHPYTQFNRTWKGFIIRNTITIDIDEPMALEVFRERAGLEPNLWVLNPGKAMSGHVSLVLSKAVFVPVGAKPRPWFQGIRREAWEVLLLLEEWLVAVCKADKAITTQKTKTPGHPDHITYWREGNLRSLGELAEWIDWSRVQQDIPRGTPRTSTGRNDTLYMRALYAGCDYAAAGAQSVDDVLEHLMGRVDTLNDFVEPLSLAEVRATLKSAAKQAWARRDTWKPRGAAKQAKPAFTREQRTEGTLQRLVEAGKQLVSSGLELAKKALARAAHAGINTVRRYWDRVQSACLQGSTEGGSDLSTEYMAADPISEPPLSITLVNEPVEAQIAPNAPAQVPNSRKAPVLKVLRPVFKASRSDTESENTHDTSNHPSILHALASAVASTAKPLSWQCPAWLPNLRSCSDWPTSPRYSASRTPICSSTPAGWFMGRDLPPVARAGTSPRDSFRRYPLCDLCVSEARDEALDLLPRPHEAHWMHLSQGRDAQGRHHGSAP